MQENELRTELHPVVLEYLRTFELLLKQRHGVRPEEAISDAREFLSTEIDNLLIQSPELDDTQLRCHLHLAFGTPQEITDEYANNAGPIGKEKTGYAPGWRICCTKCGIGTTAAKAGITRVGARSYQKYILGYCRHCRSFRFIRLIRDLNMTNISDGIHPNESSDSFRKRFHRPIATILAILASVALTILVTLALLSARAPITSAADVTSSLPDGWSVRKTLTANPTQTAAIASKLGVEITTIRNTILSAEGTRLQLNELSCRSNESAKAVRDAILKTDSGNRIRCTVRGNTATEIVCPDMRLAVKAWQKLVQPKEVTYRIRFEAAPLAKSEPMEWNRLVNLFLRLQNATIADAELDELRTKSKKLKVSDRLALRSVGLGDSPIEWKFESPAPSDCVKGNEVNLYVLPNMKRRQNVPFVSVSGKVTSRTYGRVTPQHPVDREKLTEATPHWPVTAPAIRKLSMQITENCETDADKVAAIFEWHRHSDNIRFGGDVTGSRYGVDNVITQKFGHCADFADVFVTLCRASGIPSRMVLGWLYEVSGHVWAEVLVDGEWRQIDPTGVAECGSNYIPIMTTETGEYPLLYVSKVTVDEISPAP